MDKRGRPRSKGYVKKKVEKLRGQWRKAAAKYYKKNKEKILKKESDKGIKERGSRRRGVSENLANYIN